MLHHQIEVEVVRNMPMLHAKHIASRPLKVGEVTPVEIYIWWGYRWTSDCKGSDIYGMVSCVCDG